MTIKQISVFLVNKKGRLKEVLQILADNEVNIVSIYLADTAEYGMLRLVVADPEKGRQVLRDNNIMAELVEVIAVKVSHTCGSLCAVMTELVNEGINIEYMYAFANEEDASFIFKTKEVEKAIKAIEAKGFELLKSEEAYNLNR